ncbi:MAG TPA: glycosyltransferase family 4 protein [Candidatus Acidoferrales bacterium]|nr:glycosyltransferase family 4 protein [Candidatus Acidoferrales bacterium]
MTSLYVDLETGWRGGQGQALLTLRWLRKLGQPAELVAARGCPLAQRAAAEGIVVHEVGALGARWQCARLLRRLLGTSRYALVHANEPHALTAAWLARAHRRVPLVFSRRVAYPLGQSPLALARYRAAKRILAISRFVAASVIESGIAPGHVETVYEGVEVPELPTAECRDRARQRWGVRADETLLGCVGYLLPEKGQLQLVQALAGVRKQFPQCRLILAGDGPSRAELEQLVRELGLGEAVIFAGFVEDIAQMYAALDAFVFPSLAEPLGTSLLAAMAWGLPVVAVARGGVPEIVEDGRTGLLVDAPDPALLAESIVRLLSDAGLAKRLRQAARENIEQQFSAERMAANTLRVYQEQCAEGGNE